MNETNQRRGPWYLLTGLLLGFLAGLIYTSWIAPVRLINTEPKILSSTAKDEYRRLIALAYASNKDLGRASARLSLLGDEIPTTALLDTSTRLRKKNAPLAAVQALENLARDLQTGHKQIEKSQPSLTPTSQPDQEKEKKETDSSGSIEDSSGTEAALGVQTATPIPTKPTTPVEPTYSSPIALTPIPSMDVAFTLLKQRQVCDPSLPAGLIQIMVEDGEGDPLAGVRITVAWGDGQEETFYSGLYPQISLGYADFQMQPSQRYWLKVGNSDDLISDLEMPSCTNNEGSTYGGGWLLYFAAKSFTSG